MTSKIELYQGPCLELMKQIPDGSVDMILADLPYGTTACKWDVVIPFEPLWEHYWRVLKPNGAVVLFGIEPFSSRLRMSQIQYHKYDWVWAKSKAGNFIQIKNMPAIKHEMISVFSKGVVIHQGQSINRMPYFPQGVSVYDESFTRPTICSKNSEHKYFRESHSKKRVIKEHNFPISILNFPSEQNTYHPTQKPVALLEYLIKTYTLEGETVLDNVMGSGSTGVACINTNRNFIGMEKDEKYFNIAKERIEKAQVAPEKT